MAIDGWCIALLRPSPTKCAGLRRLDPISEVFGEHFSPIPERINETHTLANNLYRLGTVVCFRDFDLTGAKPFLKCNRLCHRSKQPPGPYLRAGWATLCGGRWDGGYRFYRGHMHPGGAAGRPLPL